MKKYRWKFLFTAPNGHRYWSCADSGRVALSDESGDDDRRPRRTGRPHETEDGVLWLDRSRPCVAYGRSFTIPVVDEQGKQSHTPAGTAETLLVATRFGMKLAVPTIDGDNIFAVDYAKRTENQQYAG